MRRSGEEDVDNTSASCWYGFGMHPLLGRLKSLAGAGVMLWAYMGREEHGWTGKLGCPCPLSGGDKKPHTSHPAPSRWLLGQLLAFGEKTGTDPVKTRYFSPQ